MVFSPKLRTANGRRSLKVVKQSPGRAKPKNLKIWVAKDWKSIPDISKGPLTKVNRKIKLWASRKGMCLGEVSENALTRVKKKRQKLDWAEQKMRYEGLDFRLLIESLKAQIDTIRSEVLIDPESEEPPRKLQSPKSAQTFKTRLKNMSRCNEEIHREPMHQKIQSRLTEVFEKLKREGTTSLLDEEYVPLLEFMVVERGLTEEAADLLYEFPEYENSLQKSKHIHKLFNLFLAHPCPEAICSLAKKIDAEMILQPYGAELLQAMSQSAVFLVDLKSARKLFMLALSRARRYPSEDVSPAVRTVIAAHCDMGDTARAHQLFGILLTCSAIQIPAKTYEGLQIKLIEDGHYDRSARLHNRLLRTRRMPAGDAIESFLLALAKTGSFGAFHHVYRQMLQEQFTDIKPLHKVVLTLLMDSPRRVRLYASRIPPLERSPSHINHFLQSILLKQAGKDATKQSYRYLPYETLLSAFGYVEDFGRVCDRKTLVLIDALMLQSTRFLPNLVHDASGSRLLEAIRHLIKSSHLESAFEYRDVLKERKGLIPTCVYNRMIRSRLESRKLCSAERVYLEMRDAHSSENASTREMMTLVALRRKGPVALLPRFKSMIQDGWVPGASISHLLVEAGMDVESKQKVTALLRSSYPKARYIPAKLKGSW
ncbi:hypothetical protein NDN08_006059 [Rhodosorus marinus]|uniref:Uncharacterized protein n=1 Tax=Rhodosorus marinus TaxID=101924 RepID=A0AAV8UL63_9RHOD|nr:hypothetical protein NDN08_006059 [Rhodosorus marinus]